MKRPPGISGVFRLRNEIGFLKEVIVSHLPFLDELMIVCNGCTDGSDEVAQQFADHPKVRVMEYPYTVYAQGTREYELTNEESVSSLAALYNIAFAASRFSICVKVDGDHLAVPSLFGPMCDQLRQSCPESTFFGVRGLNLLACPNGRLGVFRHRTLCGGRDMGFFRWAGFAMYRKGPHCELLTMPDQYKSLGVGFYHLKGLKPDFGSGVWDLEHNPNSYYQSVAVGWRRGKAIPFEEFRERGTPDQETELPTSVRKQLPSPEELLQKVRKDPVFLKVSAKGNASQS